MDFSEAYKCSGLPPSISPDGRYLAHTVDIRLVIRDVETLGVVQLYSCLDNISEFSWSPDSQYVLCVLDGRGIVQVWSATLGDWKCKIDEGPAGIIDACWTPDSRHIVTCADFNLRLGIWSLLDKACVHIPAPKFKAGGLSFSPDGKLMAVGHRKQCKDYVSVVATGSWSEVQRFQVPTQDMAGLAFSPDGAHIAVWDSSLHNRAAVFTLDGTQVASVDGQDHGLGVRTAAWSPGGDFFAIAMHSGVLKLLESATWTVVAELDHPDTVEAPATCVVYNEEPAQDGRSRFAVASVPVALGPGQQAQGRGRKGAQEAGAEGTGVGRVVFSPCGTYVATVDDGNAGCVWVWALARMQLLSVVSLLRPPTELLWAPHSVAAGDASLCILNGGTKMYLWTPDGASCIHVPLPNFRPQSGSFGGGGAVLALGDQRALCCAYTAT